MNETISKFLIAGDKFMPEMHLRQLGFTYNACGPFTKNKELNLNTQIEEQLLIKYYVIKDLILLKIQKMMEINVDLLQWSTDFLLKKLAVEQLKIEIFLIKNQQKIYTNQLLEILMKEEYTHLLQTIFVVQI